MRISASELADVRACAQAMAAAARAVTLALFRSPGLTADNKAESGFDPVTAADREAEAAMRAVLAKRRPQDGIVGEELGHQRGTSGLTWVLDPIDGTRAFLIGAPSWGTLIALCDGDGPVYGMIDQPYLDERFEGFGDHALLTRAARAQPIKTAQTKTLAQARLLSTFPEVGTEAEARAFHAVSAQCRLTRYGLDCYGYALVALGQADLVIEAGLNSYDIAAPIAVIQGAGGVLTDWQGGPAHHGGRALAAATPELHRAALEVLNAAP